MLDHYQILQQNHLEVVEVVGSYQNQDPVVDKQEVVDDIDLDHSLEESYCLDIHQLVEIGCCC